MTREELRNYVEEQRNLDVIPYHVYSTLVDGIDTLEQEPKSEWIPVSERLPDRKKYSQGEIWERSVLVTSYFSWDDKKETFISYELAEDVIDNNFVDKCVTAWMPLPEPYKAEKGEIR